MRRGLKARLEKERAEVPARMVNEYEVGELECPKAVKPGFLSVGRVL